MTARERGRVTVKLTFQKINYHKEKLDSSFKCQTKDLFIKISFHDLINRNSNNTKEVLLNKNNGLENRLSVNITFFKIYGI